MPTKVFLFKNLRIAFLLDRGPETWQSQETFHYRLCRALMERGATPVLIYSGHVPPDVEVRLRDGGIEVVAADRLRGMRHYRKVVSSTFERFDINFVHIRYFIYHSSIHWLARALSVKHIVFTEANSWLPSHRSLLSWKRQATWLRTQFACWPITRHIAISDFVRKGLIRNGVNANKIDIVYNGVDLKNYQADHSLRETWRKQNNILPEEFVIASVSRLAPEKDIPTVLRAFAELLRRGMRTKLFIAGSGPLEAELKELADSLGIAGQTRWLGHVADPIPLYHGCDVFTLASRGEAFGFVLTEAMACGKPIVGSSCGAIGEIVEHGETGLLATPGEHIAFANAYEQLYQESDKRVAMGQAGLKRVAAKFSLDSSVEKTLAVYENILR